MAVTHGHGNPNWTREEVILALDLYFSCDGDVPDSSDPRVKAVSKLLRSFPHHATAARQPSFRNADGVAFKLQNIRQVATGRGLKNVSQVDRSVWVELGRDPKRTAELAALIRAGIEVSSAESDAISDDVFSEGRVVTESHLRRERNPKLRNALIEHHRMKFGELRCEVCNCAAAIVPNDLGDAMFEAHHVVPLATTDERQTKLKDLTLICANCHRILHRAICVRKKWFTVMEARQEIFSVSLHPVASK